jgi:multicomponent Na+:H+ antiporter subunit D
MMGAPLTAGAISKEWLTKGAVTADMEWAAWVLTASSLLNAAYFLPILYRLWCRAQPAGWPQEEIAARGWRETTWLLLVPPLCTAAAVLAVNLLADASFSPLALAKLIAGREYVDLSQ